ncbi:MAG: GtrA family protein [Prevotellaceae bacterium]|nr:GtrA family protein [Prevotellaceae bacterium]
MKQLPEFIRFVLVGVTATAVHYGIYLGIQSFLPVNVAYTIGYAVSFVLNFYLTAFFTFRRAPSWRRGMGFGGAHLVNYLLHLVLLNLFLWLGINRQLAPLPVYAIAIPVNFLLVRFVFKRK